MKNTTQPKSHTALLVTIALLFLATMGLAIYFGVITKKPPVAEVKIDGMYLPTSKEMIDFQLTDNAGKSFTKANLKGHWTMMFFGFTNCGMVCPTTMAALNDMYKNLEHELPQERLPAVVMISVDPDRDSVERMNEYVSAFNSHFVGARAEMPQIETLEKELHLVAVKMQADGDAKNQYTINHSAEIMLFNPEGKLQAFMSYPHKADQMAKDYKAVLTAQSQA
jgi:protein SCO1/2